MPQRSLHGCWPERATLAAALVLGAVDVGLVLHHGGSVRLAGTALALVLSVATLAALTLRLSLAIIGRVAPGGRGPALAGAGLLLPAIILISFKLFTGTGISTRWYAPLGGYLVTPLLFGMTALVLHLAGAIYRRLSPGGARLAPLPLLLGAGAIFAWADFRLYPHQYSYLHWTLLGLTWAALVCSAWLLLGRPEAGARQDRRPTSPGGWFALVVLLAALPAVVLAGFYGVSDTTQRQLLDHRTHTAGRLAQVARRLADRDGDRHSVVFGERDCDNSNPAIYPLAEDLPRNGVDEDCDGADAMPKPVAKVKPNPRVLDPDAYRRYLQTWAQRPRVVALLDRTAAHNVVLVVVDALRADQTKETAENRANNPKILDFIKSATWFSHAFSPGAGTDIGMAALLTGRLDLDGTTLLSAFSRAGVRTHGVFQREVKRWVERQFRLRGLDGRSVVINDPLRRDLGTHATARMVTNYGIRFLKANENKRFFLWLHYFDVHEHHQIDFARIVRRGEQKPAAGMPAYRRALHHVDGQLGRFLDNLERRGLADNTVVVLVADHGEGLSQTPRLPQYHGELLYNALVHVPLAIRVPGQPGRRRDQPASLVDVTPTLLQLAGIPPLPSDGVSLAPLVLGDQPDLPRALTRPIYLMESKQQAVISWPWKLLSRLDTGLVELYHLDRDFAEEQNLLDQNSARATAMAATLRRKNLLVIDRLKVRKGR